LNKRQIKLGLDHIAARDKHVAAALERIGYPEPRQRPAGFETFIRTVVSQQISVRAAASIWERLRAQLPALDAAALLSVPEQNLRGAGLSARKAEYLRGLAAAIVDGSFDPDSLISLPDEEAIDSIKALRGFGRWSAEIYLMFSLGRSDIFPADDLIILSSLQKVKNMRQRPTPAKAREKVASWAPWRRAGALFLWHFHHQNSGKDSP